MWRRPARPAVPTAVPRRARPSCSAPGWTCGRHQARPRTSTRAGSSPAPLSLWDPLAAGGQLQNQAYGYLFPMGPFFWLGHRTEPAGLGRRSGCGGPSILVVATTVRGWCSSGSASARAGRATSVPFAYALAPRMVVGLGRDQLRDLADGPRALGAARRCSRSRPAASARGRPALRRRRAAARRPSTRWRHSPCSCCPFWWIITRQEPCGGACSRGGPLAVALATAWWVGPLLLLGRYSPPFLGLDRGRQGHHGSRGRQDGGPAGHHAVDRRHRRCAGPGVARRLAGAHLSQPRPVRSRRRR